jgi:AraC family transcriptional regulator
MIIGSDEVYLAQQNGGLPMTLAAGSAPGESGVSILSLRFKDGAHFSATPQQHLIWFQLSDVRIECRRAGRKITQDAPGGTLAICPAGMDCAADTEENVDALVVAIGAGRLALTAAEDSALEAQLIERLSGYDETLLELARNLVSESADGYPNGPLFWNEVASAFVGGLVDRHTSKRESRKRGTLGKSVLERLKEYVIVHLDEPIDVAALANIAGRSPFHFSRIFARSVGVTPYRYVIHLRLQRAIELIRDDLVWLKSPLPQASPTKAIYRAGSSAFMGFPSLGLPPERKQNSRNFHDRPFAFSYMRHMRSQRVCHRRSENGGSRHTNIGQTRPATAGPLINIGRRPICSGNGDLGEAACRHAARGGALSELGRRATDNSSCARLQSSFVRARWRP